MPGPPGMKKFAELHSHGRHLFAKAGISRNLKNAPSRVASSNIFVSTAATIPRCQKHIWDTREYIAGEKYLPVVNTTKANASA